MLFVRGHRISFGSGLGSVALTFAVTFRFKTYPLSRLMCGTFCYFY